MFGFVTYKHLPSVSYALNVFNGSKLFGRELQLRNRNANKNRDPPQSHHNQQSSSLVHGFQHFAPSYTGTDLAPVNQVLLQQQLLMLATSGQNVQSFVNAGAQMFTGASYDNNFASTRSDTAGSHREHYVERNRYHREENRSTRSKPYHRSRSRSHSPPQQRKRNRSPPDSRSRHNDKGRRTDDRSNYHRWGKRWFTLRPIKTISTHISSLENCLYFCFNLRCTLFWFCFKKENQSSNLHTLRRREDGSRANYRHRKRRRMMRSLICGIEVHGTARRVFCFMRLSTIWVIIYGSLEISWGATIN